MNDPMIELFIAADLFLKGERVGGFEKRRAHSWVKNFYNRLVVNHCGTACSSTDDTDIRMSNNVARQSDTGTPNTDKMLHFRVDNGDNDIVGGSGSDARGIIVGSGTNAEDFGMGVSPAAESYGMQTKIDNGNSAGELSYAIMNAVIPSTSGSPNVLFTSAWERYFNNTSGGNVTVNEVGLYAEDTMGFSGSFLLARDLLVSPLIIADSGQLKVTYTITFTVPGEFVLE